MAEGTCEPLRYVDPNVTDHVLLILGERCPPSPAVALPIVLGYALIFVVGVAGNACTCAVIATNRSMHNPTNYYLFSLAVSDLLLLFVGLPMELYGVLSDVYPYQFPEWVCKGRAFFVEFTSYASILVICAFSVERWLAICFPLHAKLFSALSRSYVVILAVWFVSFAAALPMAFLVRVNRLPIPEFVTDENATRQMSVDGVFLVGTDFCAMDVDRPDQQRLLIWLAFGVFFALPAVMISLVYGHIAIRLRSADRLLRSESKSKSNGSGGTSNQHVTERQHKSRKSVLRVLISVVITFFLFWLPFHSQRLLSVVLGGQDGDVADWVRVTFQLLFYISGYCYYSNSAMNAILYNILSQKYRRAFCRTILGTRLTRRLLPKAAITVAATFIENQNNNNNNTTSRPTITAATAQHLRQTTPMMALHKNRALLPLRKPTRCYDYAVSTTNSNSGGGGSRLDNQHTVLVTSPLLLAETKQRNDGAI